MSRDWAENLLAEQKEEEGQSEELLKNKKLADKALNHYQKGEKHLASGKYSKAESDFKKAVEVFIQANDLKRAERCSLKLCECFIIEKKHYDAAKAAYYAADLILHFKKYKNAIKHYQSVIDFYEKVDAELEILEVYSIIALCNVAQGKFDDGIALMKKKVAKSTFPQIKKNKIIQFAIVVINTILQKKADNLDEIELQLNKIKVDEGVYSLFKTVKRLLAHYINTIVAITADKKEIRAGDTIEVSVLIKKPPDLEIIDSTLAFDRLFDLVDDKQIGSDNRKIVFKLRPRIQGKLKVGPLSLICKIEEFQFPLKVLKTFEILPGKPKLIIEPELPEISVSIGEPVAISLNLKNLGKGECMNLSFALTLPEELELAEGSQEKKLHSLGPKEEFLFTFRILANEKVDTNLSATVTFEDLEGNQHTIDMESIPFSASS
ncbi:MAG: hypothetical protein HWN65_23885 [Candidatus Helarchaeota archaeon]|nr:hypothetical protein [Candidatus Helarchaeota archaeon]